MAFSEIFTCGIQRVVPSGQDGSILPARVANHSARFRQVSFAGHRSQVTGQRIFPCSKIMFHCIILMENFIGMVSVLNGLKYSFHACSVAYILSL